MRKAIDRKTKLCLLVFCFGNTNIIFSHGTKKSEELIISSVPCSRKIEFQDQLYCASEPYIEVFSSDGERWDEFSTNDLNLSINVSYHIHSREDLSKEFLTEVVFHSRNNDHYIEEWTSTLNFREEGVWDFTIPYILPRHIKSPKLLCHTEANKKGFSPHNNGFLIRYSDRFKVTLKFEIDYNKQKKNNRFVSEGTFPIAIICNKFGSN